MLLSCWWALYLWAQCCANGESAGFSALVFQISDLEKESFLGRATDFSFQCLLNSWHFYWDCWSISANCVGFWDMVLEQSSEVAAFCHLPSLDSVCELWFLLSYFSFLLRGDALLTLKWSLTLHIQFWMFHIKYWKSLGYYSLSFFAPKRSILLLQVPTQQAIWNKCLSPLSVAEIKHQISEVKWKLLNIWNSWAPLRRLGA